MRSYKLAQAAFLPLTGQTQRAYLAGIFDGEGNLYAQRRQPASFPRWQLSVGNTDTNLMAWLAAFGGNVRLLGRAGHNKRTKDYYCWRLTGAANVLRFLLAVRPWLIIKRLTADEAIKTIRARMAITEGGNEDAIHTGDDLNLEGRF